MECLICNDGKDYKRLGSHIHKNHNITSQEYYDEYILEGEKPICECGCGRFTKFRDLNYGYSNTYSKSCAGKMLWKDEEKAKLRNEKASESIAKLFNNSEYKKKFSESSKKTWQDPDHKEKVSKSLKKKWGEDGYKDRLSKAIKDSESHKAAMSRLGQMAKKGTPQECIIFNHLINSIL
jgi:hypothetical protein